MNISEYYLLSLRDYFLTERHFEQREDLLLKAKRVRVASAALGALSSAVALSFLARGKIAIFSPMIAYASYEMWTLSNNVVKTMTNPAEEVQVALALYQSGETAIRKLGQGAPVMSEILVLFAKRYDMAGPPMVVFKKQLLEFCRRKVHLSVDDFFSQVLTPYFFQDNLRFFLKTGF